jgi:hypothetical protein
MEKEFATYEQASALKELGFDESCFATYDEDKEFEIQDFEQTYDTFPSHIIAAPLKQQAFRWFREKHNLRSFVDTRVTSVDNPNMWVYDFQIKMGNGVDTQPFYSGDFDTYEEAELECLKKLIEIVKQKQ